MKNKNTSDEKQFTLGPISVSGKSLLSIRSIGIEFGVTVEAVSTDSNDHVLDCAAYAAEAVSLARIEYIAHKKAADAVELKAKKVFQPFLQKIADGLVKQWKTEQRDSWWIIDCVPPEFTLDVNPCEWWQGGDDDPGFDLAA